MTSYLCENGFPAVAVIKSKYSSKINVEQEMRGACCVQSDSKAGS